MKSACLFYTIQASGYFHRSGLHAVLSSKSSHWWVLSNQMHLMGLRQIKCTGCIGKGDEDRAGGMPRARKPASPFRYFNSSPEVIRLVVLMYVRFPLSLRT